MQFLALVLGLVASVVASDLTTKLGLAAAAADYHVFYPNIGKITRVCISFSS